MKFEKNQTTWGFIPDARFAVHNELPIGTYTICMHPLSGEYFLEESEPFTLPSRIYGNTVRYAERILDAFVNTTHQTGVLLSGSKGSGKTLLCKYIAVKSQVPVIIVPKPFSNDKFMQTLQGITQRAIIIFDEFEKMYDDDDQGKLLTMFDGVYSLQNKLVILTCNDKYKVRDFFHNRPSRIRYSINFNGLDAKFIKEFCEANLIDQSYIDDVLKTAIGCYEFNFDMLAALVREINIYGGKIDDIVEILNVKPISTRTEEWAITITSPEAQGVVFTSQSKLTQSPMLVLTDGDGSELNIRYRATGKHENKNINETGSNIEIHFDDLVSADPLKQVYLFKGKTRVDTADAKNSRDGGSIPLSVLVKINQSDLPGASWTLGGF